MTDCSPTFGYTYFTITIYRILLVTSSVLLWPKRQPWKLYLTAQPAENCQTVLLLSPVRFVLIILWMDGVCLAHTRSAFIACTTINRVFRPPIIVRRVENRLCRLKINSTHFLSIHSLTPSLIWCASTSRLKVSEFARPGNGDCSALVVSELSRFVLNGMFIVYNTVDKYFQRQLSKAWFPYMC